MAKGYGDNDGHSLAEAFHVQDSLILHALRRQINDNDSNTCEECDIIIPEARLAIVPNAKYCVHCQSLQDRQTLKFECRNRYVP